MIILNELYRLGFFGGCRFRPAMSFSAAAAAASNQVLQLQQTLPGPSGILGEMLSKLGPCPSVTSWWPSDVPQNKIAGHSGVELLDQGAPSSPCEKGIQQILEFKGPPTSSCHERVTLKGWISPTISVPDSQTTSLEYPSDRRDSPGERKQQDADQGFKTSGREDTVVTVVSEQQKMFKKNFSNPIMLSELKVLDGNHKCAGPGNLTETAILGKQPPERNLKRSFKLLEKPVQIHGNSGTLKPAMECNSESRQPRRRPMSVYALNKRISILMEAGYHDEASLVYEQILPACCKPDSYTYLHMIKGFCEAGELAEAREIFREIIGDEGLPCGGFEPIAYNMMIHGLGAAGFVNEALNLVQEMTDRGCLPDVYTYNSIIHILGKVGKVNDALTVFESMAENDCTPDVVTYNSLILSLGKAGRIMEAYTVYEGMIERGCLPDLFTFNTLLPILGKSGKVNLAMNLYNFMKLVGCHPDVYTYTSLVVNLCRAGRVDEALLFSVEMTEKGCAPNNVTFNSWLDGLCKDGRVVEAHLLFHKMLELGYVPDNITYSILIDAFCKRRQFLDDSFNLLKDLLKSTDSLDSRTSEIVFQSFKKAGMLKQAKRIARNARAKQSHFNNLSLRG